MGWNFGTFGVIMPSVPKSPLILLRGGVRTVCAQGSGVPVWHAFSLLGASLVLLGRILHSCCACCRFRWVLDVWGQSWLDFGSIFQRFLVFLVGQIDAPQTHAIFDRCFCFFSIFLSSISLKISVSPRREQYF